MPTYTQFDPTKPVSSAAGPQVPVDTLNNLKAIRDGVQMGCMMGVAYSFYTDTGYTAERPHYDIQSRGVERLRATNFYGSGADEGRVVKIWWEYSPDSGSTPNGTGTWQAIGTEAFSYDAGGNVTTTPTEGALV